MAFDLSIAGITTVRISVGTWQEEEVDCRGVFRRVSNGSGQNSQRSPKRGFTGTFFFTTSAEYDAVLTAISVPGQPGVATPVIVSSPPDGGLRGASLTCYCWLGRSPALKNGDSAYWKAAIQIREA